MNKLPAQKVDGLIDGLSVIHELAICEEPISGLELSRSLNLSPVRVNRLLKTLAYLGFAYRTTSRKYKIGSAMHILAAQSMRASGLLSKLFIHLEHLGRSGNTVALGVLWNGEVCYLYHRNPGMDLWDGIASMPTISARDSSIGMTLLAELKDNELENIYKDKNNEDFFNQIDKIREKGYAAIKHSNHTSLAIKIGSPAYAAIAVSNIKSKKEFNFFLKELQIIANKNHKI